MRLRNDRQAMVLVPQQQLCIESRTDNRLGEDNSRLSSSLVSSVIENENNNDSTNLPSRIRLCSETNSLSSRDDSVGDDEGQSSSSLDIFPQGDEYHYFSQEDVTDSDFSDDGNCGKDDFESNTCCGITNPNYPGFDAFADNLTLLADSNGNNNSSESVNHLDSAEHFQKDFYDKPKFETCTSAIVQDLNIVSDSEQELNIVSGDSVSGTDNVFPEINYVISSSDHKFEFSPNEVLQDSGVASAGTTDTELESFESSFLVETVLYPVSGVFETTVIPEDESPSPGEDTQKYNFCSNEAATCEIKEQGSQKNLLASNMASSDDYSDKHTKTMEVTAKSAKDSANEKRVFELEAEKKKRDNLTKCDVGIHPGVPGLLQSSGKKDLPKRVDPLFDVSVRKVEAFTDVIARRSGTERGRTCMNNRRSISSHGKKDQGVFDVYNIETAMPNIDLEAIESHLRTAREEERKRRNDREEIRRRLAMGTDSDDFYASGRKPSLQSRLQGGMNLQICFMNDTGSDSESPSTDADAPASVPCVAIENMRPTHLPIKTGQIEPIHAVRPPPTRLNLSAKNDFEIRTESDLFACQTRLQAEARHALMQAKEMARMQMEVERQNMPLSPITQMVRSSLLKVGIPFPEGRRRLSRQILTEMNVAQLQVIINDLHSQIEVLNENLVEYLMSRDDLHMEQDSMLVDIEDLTRYLGAKERVHGDDSESVSSNNNKNLQMHPTVQV